MAAREATSEARFLLGIPFGVARAAYGGGSVDITGKVKSIDKKDKVPLVEVTEYRVTPKPKPGAFKGCL